MRRNLQGAALAPLAGLTGLKELYLFGKQNLGYITHRRINRVKSLDLSQRHFGYITHSRVIQLEVDEPPQQQDIGHIGACRINQFNMAGCLRKRNLRPFSLVGLRPSMKFLGTYDNPGFPQGGPKIEGTMVMGLFAGHTTG